MLDIPVIDHHRLPIMTIDCAHVIMQKHLECTATTCPLKAQAKHRLTTPGHLVPADVAHRGF
ncbi:hypothetical protein NRB20_47480 [Nocardia sp. RB20]|uniref:Uncharacterized protein n=1 Tax=Nocardia macrotermitis TaxID=2585198 RepID=A0A7K0D7A2_9NOCA|nr:hypothetical protein [Nocardia macrotermitis]